MSSQAYADRLAGALTRTGFVEVVEASFTDNRITVLFRLKAGVDHKWLEIVNDLLQATERYRNSGFGWSSHICKTFFLKDVKKEKKLVFGWHMAITSQHIPTALDTIIKVVSGEAPPEPAVSDEQIQEVPLVGAPRERNAPGSGGRGAYGIGGREGGFRPPVRR